MRIAAFLILAAVSSCVMHAAAPDEEESRKSGEAWLSLVDAQKYDESWKEASAQFRSAVTQEQWAAALKGARDPLGPMVSRTSARVNFTKTLRGAPDGDYAIFHFTTVFKNKEGVTERLTLVQEEGKWRVTAYAIH
ncbi:MAG TPA: DUF4019 domain-containing protein [Bryobacteraceae bacterium]|jgi:hypothetical protein|nr:DUF4019 domain-containing protein [Bryobacteraceae bacterium]